MNKNNNELYKLEVGSPLHTAIKDHPEAQNQLLEALTQIRATAVADRDREIASKVKELGKNLVSLNESDGRCNPRCHDSGKKEIIDQVLSITHKE